jgi:hypothetical protein
MTLQKREKHIHLVAWIYCTLIPACLVFVWGLKKIDSRSQVCPHTSDFLTSGLYRQPLVVSFGSLEPASLVQG